MGHLIESRTISIPPKRVFEAVRNLADSARWSRQCAESKAIRGNGEVGTRARLRMYDGTVMVQEVISVDEPRRCVSFEMFELPKPVAAMSAEWRVTQTAPGQSEVTIEADYALTGGMFGRALDALVVRRLFRRAHLTMLADLDHHLSSGELIDKNGPVVGSGGSDVQP